MTSSRTGVAPIYNETQSLVDRVTHVVRQSIVDGSLRPGEAVSISDLATDLGVSHSPVREAIQRLSAQGLIQLRPARTAMVAPLKVDDLHDIYRLRKLIEVDAAVRAAPDLTDKDLKELERQFEIMVQTDIDTDEFWRLHDEFHRGLMRPAATDRLTQIVNELWKAAERYIRVVYSEEGIMRVHSAEERHRPLLEIARTRDGAAMGKALTEHLESNEAEISTHLAQILDAAAAKA